MAWGRKFPIERVLLEGPSPLVSHRFVEGHLDWLERESRIHNLTSVPREDWPERHVLDSWAPAIAGWDVGERFLDLGTGAGFPGLPLAACFERAAFTLLESKAKLARLLGQFLTSSPLGSRGEVLAERAEVAAHHPSRRGNYSTVVTRAVASLPVLIELGVPFLQSGGELWCWKSDLEEVAGVGEALTALSAEIARALRYRLPSETRDRYVIAIRRVGDLDSRYPRKPGIPAKRPLSSQLSLVPPSPSDDSN